MKRGILFLVIFILFISSVNATVVVNKIYTSSDFGADINNWKKIDIEPDIKTINFMYTDDKTGNIYFIPEYHETIYRIRNGETTYETFNNGLFYGFRPHGIRRLNNILFVWGDDSQNIGASVFFLDEVNNKWINSDLGSRSTYWVTYDNSKFWSQGSTYYSLVFTYSSPPIGGVWVISSVSGDKDPLLVVGNGSSIYHAGLDYYINKPIVKTGLQWNGEIIGYFNGIVTDLEVARGNDLWAISERKLFKWSGQINWVQKISDIDLVEINKLNYKLVIADKTKVKTYDPTTSTSNLILDINGESGYNQITSLEADGNNIYVGVKYYCKDSDGDEYSGEDLTKYGQVICTKTDCDDDKSDDPTGCPATTSGCNELTSKCAICIYPGASEYCDGIKNNCDGQMDSGCTCTSGSVGSCGFDANKDEIINSSDNIGECLIGTKSCITGAWTNCIGNVPNTDEVCTGDKDEDCDGLTDCGINGINYDENCMTAGACTCSEDNQCSTDGTKVCDTVSNKCSAKCVSDSDCGANICNTISGKCNIPIPPITSCSEADEDNCFSVNSDNILATFDCYWDDGIWGLGSGCKPIKTTTTCDDLNINICGLTLTIPTLNCQVDGDECVASEGAPAASVGCASGFPQDADGVVCGGTAATTNCDKDTNCDYGELCGGLDSNNNLCSDCEGYGMGGCAADKWCDPSAGCTTPPEELSCVEDLGGSLSACPAGERCLNTYYLLSDNPFQTGLIDLNNDEIAECCLGQCSNGEQEFSASGDITVYSEDPDCIAESGSSTGKRTTYTNGVATGSVDCTILSKNKVPFSSALGILAGLMIIILFYILRKKY